MTRAQMRAHLKATDPQPNYGRDHAIFTANRTLAARLEANRVAHGWPKVPVGPVSEVRERVVPPAVQRPPVRAPQPPVVSEQPIYDNPDYAEAIG